VIHNLYPNFYTLLQSIETISYDDRVEGIILKLLNFMKQYSISILT